MVESCGESNPSICAQMHHLEVILTSLISVFCFVWQFTVTKVDEDEKPDAQEKTDNKSNKNGPVSQFHLLQV